MRVAGWGLDESGWLGLLNLLFNTKLYLLFVIQ